MHYFVTGATGFIGKRLVAKLLQRKGSVVHFLIRKESEGKVAGLREYWGVGAARAVPVFGDLTSKKLGVSSEDVKALKGQIDHFHHLAAVAQLGADPAVAVALELVGDRPDLGLGRDLLRLDPKDLGTLVRAIESSLLVPALKGAEDKLRDKMFGCMSSRAAQSIADELADRGPMPMSEVIEAQKAIVQAAKRMADAGDIVIGGGGDEYV